MAKDKKLVEAITSMEEDFAQWYTDVVKKAELIDYSSVKGCMIRSKPPDQNKTGGQILLCDDGRRAGKEKRNLRG